MSNFQQPAPLDEVEPSAPRRTQFTTFASLKNRHYRWFWLGMFASFMGTQLELVARNWWVYDNTGEAFQVGIVVAAWGLPVLLLSMYGGAIADRIRKRNLLIWTQVANGIITLVIAILIQTNTIELWQLILTAGIEGVIFAIHVPARLAIIPELVRQEEVLNAVALNSASMNLSRFLGFAIGGLLLVVIGVSGVYFIVVFASFLSAGLLVLLPRAGRAVKQVTTSLWADLKECLRYIHHSSVMRSLLLMAFVSMAFGLPYLNLMPVFAKDIFDVGEPGLGYLLGAAGLGSLIGALLIASLGDYRRKGALSLTTAAAFGVSLVLFAVSAAGPFYLFSYPFALALLFMVGFIGTAYLALNNTLIQNNVPHEMLGRVMSVYVMTYALMPVGTLPLGKITDIVGAPLAIGGGGLVIVLFTLGAAVLLPRLRRLE